MLEPSVGIWKFTSVVASSIQEHKTGPFNSTADVTWTDVINSLQLLYKITINVMASLETK